MAQQHLYLGTGEPLPAAMAKIEANLTEIYNILAGLGGSITLPVASSVMLGAIKIGANIAVAADGTASVATPFSGQFADLTGVPSTVTQVNPDWNALTGAGQILNKPSLFSGQYTDLTGSPTSLSGYGITDALTGATAAATYVPQATVAQTITAAVTTLQGNGTQTANLPATTTSGFLYIPKIANPPTGHPTVKTGKVALCWDGTGLWIYDSVTGPGAASSGNNWFRIVGT